MQEFVVKVKTLSALIPKKILQMLFWSQTVFPSRIAFCACTIGVLKDVPELFEQKSGRMFAKGLKLLEKQLHFSAEIQLFIRLSSVHLKCIFDSCAEHFSLWVWKFNSQSSKLVKKLKSVQKKHQVGAVLRRRKTQISCQQCRKKFVKCWTLFRSKPQKDEKNHVAQKNCFVFKKFPAQGKCSSHGLAGHFCTICSTNFFEWGPYLNKKRLNFSTEIQFLINCWFVKLNCSCDKLAETFDLKVGNFLTQITEMMKKTYSSKKNSNWCSGDGNCSFVNIVEESQQHSNYFQPSFQNSEKQFFFFTNFVLSTKRFPVQVKCSSDSRTETFLPKSELSFAWRPKLIEKLLPFSAIIQFSIKWSSVYVKSGFDNCGKNLALKLWKFWKLLLKSWKTWEISKMSRKKTKLFSGVGKRSFFNSAEKTSTVIFFSIGPRKRYEKLKFFKSFVSLCNVRL